MPLRRSTQARRPAGLQEIIERMEPQVNPRDTFVLFAVAHGTSHDGRFYLIPQDYDSGTNPASLQERAIGQDRLQDWLANRIKAKKAILLLDTQEPGALVSGYVRSRTDLPAPEAAIGRLHQATGRPVLTATAEGKPAFEGYQGHGVFTRALLDGNGNGYIELSARGRYDQTRSTIGPPLTAESQGTEPSHYLRRFKTTSAVPPAEAAGTVYFSSSPESVNGRF
jgi:uncharacterized caspase-like protein